MDRDWDDDRDLARAIADGVVVLAPGGTIVWANVAFAELLGRELDDLVGSNGLDLIHPDELARAADGIVYASQFPGQTSAAPYRVLSGDGRWLDIELKSGILDREDGEHLILLIRDGSPRVNIKRALRSVAAGEALEHTAGLLLDAVAGRWPDTGSAVSLPQVDGTSEVVSRSLPSLLRAHASGALPPETGGPPLAELAPVGGFAVVDVGDLPTPLAEAATAAGFEGFAVAPVGAPDGSMAYLIVWFDHLIIARLEFVHAGSELVELLGLAVERHDHLGQLWHVARHDSLTGLLNRAGFLDRFDAEIDAARRDPDRSLITGVLYLDLDGLKAVNDRGGHAAGDRVLVEVADRLRSATAPGDLVARIGGDEFVVTAPLRLGHAIDELEVMAQRIEASLTIDVAGMRGPGVRVTASIGVALDQPHDPPRHVLERADAAMYRAKAVRSGGAPDGASRWSG